MRSTAALVMGRDENKHVMNLLLNAGLVPLVQRNIPQALDKLRHEHFAMIVVDRSHTDVDVLEFILNVRDIDGEIPIVVIGQSDDTLDDQILRAQPRTFVSGQYDSPEHFAREIGQILTIARRQDGECNATM